MQKTQVRFTTKTMVYHKDFDSYEEAENNANELLSLGVYNGEEILNIGIVSQQHGIKMVK